MIGTRALLEWEKPICYRMAKNLLKVLHHAAEIKGILSRLRSQDCEHMAFTRCRPLETLRLKGRRRHVWLRIGNCLVWQGQWHARVCLGYERVWNPYCYCPNFGAMVDILNSRKVFHCKLKRADCHCERKNSEKSASVAR